MIKALSPVILVIGNAISETGTVSDGNHDFTTTLNPTADGWMLSGVK